MRDKDDRSCSFLVKILAIIEHFQLSQELLMQYTDILLLIILKTLKTILMIISTMKTNMKMNRLKALKRKKKIDDRIRYSFSTMC